jgi:glutathione peroxidase
VNVASKCGLTPQYAGLEKLYETYRARGLEVLGFPCNQFAGQEPGSDADVQEFCKVRYGVSFPLYAKIDVNGATRHPLYAWLSAEDAAPEGPGDIKWNSASSSSAATAREARFAPTLRPTIRPSSRRSRGARLSARGDRHRALSHRRIPDGAARGSARRRRCEARIFAVRLTRSTST